MTSLADPFRRVEALEELSGFRLEFYGCLDARADALFEVAEAMLCLDGPVVSVPELSLASVHRRGHGALYDALACGKLNVARFTAVLARLPLPRFGGRITLAVDVSPWLRPNAECSDGRLFCHVRGKGRDGAQVVPGWPYSFVVVLEPGTSSFTALLDAVRLGPAADATEVTATQIRAVVERLIAAGQHTGSDRPIRVVLDSGYDGTRLAFLLADLPVELLVRVRSDRVFHAPAQPRTGVRGRPRRHGERMKLNDPSGHPAPDAATQLDTPRYGRAVIAGYCHRHQRLTGRGDWAGHDGAYPIIAGTLLHVTVDHLPGDRAPKPLWLWYSQPVIDTSELGALFFAFCRRFDIEHTFRMLKQTLGWTRPRLRTATAGELWTWLIIAAHTQLRLARPLSQDLRRPWERPVSDPERLTPARVRRGFRRLRPILSRPAQAPKTTRPGPGRPPGSANRHPTPHHDVGKHPKPSSETTTATSPPG